MTAFEKPVLLTARGMLHRRQPSGLMHPRCTGGRRITGLGITDRQAAGYAEGRPAVLCRYPWCFRAALIAAGFDPEVGHYSRRIKAPSIEQLMALAA